MRAQACRVLSQTTPLLLAVTLLGGCGPRESDVVKSHLKGFYFGYHNYCTFRDKGPASLEELKPHVTSCEYPEAAKKAEEEAFRRVLEGRYEIMLNVPLDVEFGKNLAEEEYVVAYEKRSGLALLGNGKVTNLSADELQKRIANTKAAVQAINN